MTAVTPSRNTPPAGTAPPTAVRPSVPMLAGSLPAAAVLLMLGEVLTPAGLDKPTTTIPAALKAVSIGAAHSTQLYTSNLLVIFGLAALAVSFVGVASLVRSRDATLGAVAAGVGGLAAFCGALANMLVGFNVAAAATAHTSPTAAAQVLVSADTSAVSTVLLVAYLGGGLVAVVLLTTALWRSRTVPRWLTVLFGVGLLVATASRPGVAAIPLQLPFAIAMVVLAMRIARPDASPSNRW